LSTLEGKKHDRNRSTVIRIPLKRETESVAVRERQKTALNAWDSIRAEDGLGKWEVAYVGASGTAQRLNFSPEANSRNAGPPASDSHTVVKVKAHTRHDADVYIPVLDLTESAEENLEDRQERLGDLFEWVGMACLGAQRCGATSTDLKVSRQSNNRLKANDRVDPYVAVYEVPSPSCIGNITHLRWRGLMDSSFVLSVINAAMYGLFDGSSGVDH
jgi:ribonuclease P/MRP protein subunit RPP40